jgi:hypothetical protein
MRQVYYPYDMWEEVNHGMYKTVDDKDKQNLIDKAIFLLSDPQELKKQMKLTTVFYKNSTERKMTCRGLNKQAWLGQAACCLKYSVPEDVTKEAWSLLTDEQRVEANRVADIVATEWVKNYAKNI